jgi:hypothetical protein
VTRFCWPRSSTRSDGSSNSPRDHLRRRSKLSLTAAIRSSGTSRCWRGCQPALRKSQGRSCGDPVDGRESAAQPRRARLLVGRLRGSHRHRTGRSAVVPGWCRVCLGFPRQGGRVGESPCSAALEMSDHRRSMDSEPSREFIDGHAGSPRLAKCRRTGLVESTLELARDGHAALPLRSPEDVHQLPSYSGEHPRAVRKLSLKVHSFVVDFTTFPWSWPGLKEEPKVSPSCLRRLRPVHFRPAASSDHGSQLERLSIVERGRVRGVEQKVWTAAELETLNPAERHELFDASVVIDLDQAPQDLIERARTRIHQRITQSEAHRG